MNIKQQVKEITGFSFISVRTGTGSMKDFIIVFTDTKNSFKEFEKELRATFNIDTLGFDSLMIRK